MYCSFSFSISPSNEYSGLITFRMDLLYLLAVQGTLTSLLQHHSSNASTLRTSAFFTVQLSHPYRTIGRTKALTRWTFVGKVMSMLFNMLSRLVIGEGNGNPLQCSCLDNPRDGGAWWASIYGVAQSRTRLKWLSSSSRLVITFLPGSKHLFISWLQSPSTVILEPPKTKSDTVSTVSPSISHNMEYWSGVPVPIPGVSISYSRGFSRTKGSNPSLLHLLHRQMDSLPQVPPGKSKTWKRKREEIKSKSTIRKQGWVNNFQWRYFCVCAIVLCGPSTGMCFFWQRLFRVPLETQV